jgi:hypothetical protein
MPTIRYPAVAVRSDDGVPEAVTSRACFRVSPTDAIEGVAPGLTFESA